MDYVTKEHVRCQFRVINLMLRVFERKIVRPVVYVLVGTMVVLEI
jgi:hypothetical protein